MANRCVRCDSDINNQQDSINCSDCAAVCHSKCVGVVTRNKRWKCENCVTESSSTSSKVSDSGTVNNTVILEAIAAFRRENNDRLDLVQSDIKSIKSDILDLKTQVATVKEDCYKVNEAVDNLKLENQRLKEELMTVKQQVLDLEQHSRKNNIIITGVPLTPNEDIYTVLGKIAEILNLKFYSSDISAAHRLQSKKGDARPPSIVVCFISRMVKAEWMASRRRKGLLTAQNLNRTFPDTPVFLNEHLTPPTRAIFNGARDLIKQKKLSSVWTSDCRVMAKTTPEQRPFRVMDLTHVAQLSTSVKPNSNSNQPRTTPSPSRKASAPAATKDNQSLSTK